MAKGKFGAFVSTSTKILDSIRKALPKNTHDLVVGIATDIEDEYRKNAPRDTGSLAESAYTQMSDSAYQHGKKTSVGAVGAKAKSLNPDAEITPLPKPSERNVAHVAPVVSHFTHVEYGTRYMAARPVLQQARNRVRANLNTKHRNLIYRVVTNGHR